jgi:hypothetical protein
VQGGEVRRGSQVARVRYRVGWWGGEGGVGGLSTRWCTELPDCLEGTGHEGKRAARQAVGLAQARDTQDPPPGVPCPGVGGEQESLGGVQGWAGTAEEECREMHPRRSGGVMGGGGRGEEGVGAAWW